MRTELQVGGLVALLGSRQLQAVGTMVGDTTPDTMMLIIQTWGVTQLAILQEDLPVIVMRTQLRHHTETLLGDLANLAAPLLRLLHLQPVPSQILQAMVRQDDNHKEDLMPASDLTLLLETVFPECSLLGYNLVNWKFSS